MDNGYLSTGLRCWIACLVAGLDLAPHPGAHALDLLRQRLQHVEALLRGGGRGQVGVVGGCQGDAQGDKEGLE